MGVAEGWGGCQLEAHPSEGWKRGPGPGSHSHISVSFLVQGERGVPGRKGVKGQKGEPGPPGLDQPCPVVRVGTEWEPQPRSSPPQAGPWPVSSLSSELPCKSQRPPCLVPAIREPPRALVLTPLHGHGSGGPTPLPRDGGWSPGQSPCRRHQPSFLSSLALKGG